MSGNDLLLTDYDVRSAERSAAARRLGFDSRSTSGMFGMSYDAPGAWAWQGDGAGGLVELYRGEPFGSPDGEGADLARARVESIDPALPQAWPASLPEPATVADAPGRTEPAPTDPDRLGGTSGRWGLPRLPSLALLLLVVLLLIGLWLIERT